jgi:nucleotide-binding universal stress UspA family protein
MAIFQRILVPTDYSEHAVEALATAARLAGEMGASVTLLHVMGESALRTAVQEGWLTADDDDETVERKAREHHEAKFDECLATLGDAGAGVERVILRGDPPREIVRYANEHGFDLVVMGRRGRTLADVVLGSAAERVVRHADCPVLIVKRRDD